MTTRSSGGLRRPDDRNRDETPCTARSAPVTPRSANSIPLADINVGDPVPVRHPDSHWPYFERLRKENPVHYCPEATPALTGRVTIQRHPQRRDQPPGLFVQLRAGRLTLRDSCRPAPAQLHLDGPAPARRAAQVVAPMFAPDPSRQARRHHPRARLPDPRQPAAQRDLRLGRHACRSS